MENEILFPYITWGIGGRIDVPTKWDVGLKCGVACGLGRWEGAEPLTEAHEVAGVGEAGGDVGRVWRGVGVVSPCGEGWRGDASFRA